MASLLENDCPSWTVVEFTASSTVEAVPTSWILGQECYWPPASKDRLQSELKKCHFPNKAWPLYEVRVFKDATYDSYSTARIKAKKAENTSDLNSDVEGKRKSIPKQIFSSSDGEDEESSTSTILDKPPIIFQSGTKTKELQADSASSLKGKQGLGISNPQSAGSFSSVNSNVTGCSCAEYQKKYEAILKEILSKQFYIKAQLRQIADDIRVLSLGRVETEVENQDSLFKQFEMPFEQNADLEKLEIYLEDPIHFKFAVIELSRIGGLTPQDFIKRAISAIMTNELAQNFSFFGAKGKRVFKSLKIWAVLKEAALKINSEFNNSVLEESLKKWLRRAKERCQYNEKKNEIKNA